MLQPDVQVVSSRGGLGPSALSSGLSQSLPGAGLPYSLQLGPSASVSTRGGEVCDAEQPAAIGWKRA